MRLAFTLTAMGNGQTNAGAFHWNESRTNTRRTETYKSLLDDFKLTGKWNQRAERIGKWWCLSNDEVDCRIDI